MSDNSVPGDWLRVTTCDTDETLAAASGLFDQYRQHYGVPPEGAGRTLGWLTDMVRSRMLTVYTASVDSSAVARPVGLATSHAVPASLVMGTVLAAARPVRAPRVPPPRSGSRAGGRSPRGSTRSRRHPSVPRDGERQRSRARALSDARIQTCRRPGIAQPRPRSPRDHVEPLAGRHRSPAAGLAGELDEGLLLVSRASERRTASSMARTPRTSWCSDRLPKARRSAGGAGVCVSR
jgi:hypothetical protein